MHCAVTLGNLTQSPVSKVSTAVQWFDPLSIGEFQIM